MRRAIAGSIESAEAETQMREQESTVSAVASDEHITDSGPWEAETSFVGKGKGPAQAKRHKAVAASAASAAGSTAGASSAST